MEASQEHHLPNYMKDDNVSQETKSLISSLPSEKDFMGYGIYNYKGCWYYPNVLQAVLDVQKHFKPRDTDIIMASLPKGGTTWLKSLVFAIVHRHKYRKNPQTHPLLSQNPHDLVPFLEIELYANSQTPDLTKFHSPMIFSTHMHLQALREATTKASSPCKIVYVCRGIKDTFVSAWHYRNMLHRTKLDQATFELMFDAYCRGVLLYGPYWEHVLSYWKGSLEDKENVLFMRYEELIEEPRVQVKRLAEFLNCPFTKKEEESGLVEEILKLCSLGNLSNLEVNKNGTTRIGVDSHAFFRKGEVGDWKNHLTPQMAKTVDEIIEYRLRGSGGPFWDHILEYWYASRENPNKVLFVTYEELKKQTGVEMKRIAEFLGCGSIEEEEVREIVKLCSFESLSNLEVNREGKLPNGIETKAFFRKGEIGGWRDTLSEALAEEIDRTMEKKFHGSGLKFSS